MEKNYRRAITNYHRIQDLITTFESEFAGIGFQDEKNIATAAESLQKF